MAELDLAIARIEEAPRQWPPYLGDTRRYLLRYYEFLEAIEDPMHPSHQEMVDWWGGPFDAGAFDLDDVNQALNRMRLSGP